jgi:hypothetical protein
VVSTVWGQMTSDGTTNKLAVTVKNGHESLLRSSYRIPEVTFECMKNKYNVRRKQKVNHTAYLPCLSFHAPILYAHVIPVARLLRSIGHDSGTSHGSRKSYVRGPAYGVSVMGRILTPTQRPAIPL